MALTVRGRGPFTQQVVVPNVLTISGYTTGRKSPWSRGKETATHNYTGILSLGVATAKCFAALLSVIPGDGLGPFSLPLFPPPNNSVSMHQFFPQGPA